MKKPKAQPVKRGKSSKASPLVVAFRDEILAEQKGVVAAAFERAQTGRGDEAQGLYHYAQGLSRSIDVLEAIAEHIASKPMA